MFPLQKLRLESQMSSFGRSFCCETLRRPDADKIFPPRVDSKREADKCWKKERSRPNSASPPFPNKAVLISWLSRKRKRSWEGERRLCSHISQEMKSAAEIFHVFHQILDENASCSISKDLFPDFI